MLLFNEVKGFATRENAVRKMLQVTRKLTGNSEMTVEDVNHFCHWHVGVNENGRFYPVVISIFGTHRDVVESNWHENTIMMNYVQYGVCIIRN